MDQYILDCTLKIIGNQKDECLWNDKLTQQEDFESFQSIIKERSKVIRKYYSENEELLKIINDYIDGPLDDEKAETLFEASRQTILTGRLDPPLTMLLTKKIADYYIANDKKERAVCAVIFYGTTTQDYYSRINWHMFIDELVYFYEWVIKNSCFYCTYEDVRARNNTILSYTNYILLLASTQDEKHVDKILKLYEELINLWNSEEVQALDGHNDDVKAIFETNSYYALMEISELCDEMDQEINSRVGKWLKAFYLLHKANPNWEKSMKNIKIRMQRHAGALSSVETIKKWEDMLDELPTPDWENDLNLSQEIFELSSDTLLSALALCKNTKHMTAEEKEKEAAILLRKYERFINRMPYAYLGSYVNAVFRQIFVGVLPIIRKMKYKEQIFHELLIRRQPSTLLHSRMVEEISVQIAEKIFEKKPEIFMSLPYDDMDDLLNHKDKILEIIARGARLHDAGKCSISSVIMQQSRKLTDDEFILIKSHPDKGYEIFVKNDASDVYTDIIRGHHKNYDGSGGYPGDFDNLSSPYKVLIDLISISDSADAATDTLGRNYVEGKDFYHLLEELKAGAGTRYNPDIVDVIANSPELIDSLAELTGSLRIKYCYEAYSQCMKLR